MIPDGIRREHIVAAIHDLVNGEDHLFGDSTGYDVLYEGQRYPPKAVVGLAAGKLTGKSLGPYDFKGALAPDAFGSSKRTSSQSLPSVIRVRFRMKSRNMSNTGKERCSGLL